MNASVVGVQVGRTAPLAWVDGHVSSAIVKHAVEVLDVARDGADGDEQADLTVHGGPDKALCCYPAEHLAWLGDTVADPAAAAPGAVGENLTIAGYDEQAARIGDVLRLGTVRAQVSQPRGPCFKLAARWSVKDLPATISRSLRTGYYLRVLEPGTIRVGDGVEVLERAAHDVTVAEVVRITYVDRADEAAVDRALAVPALAEQWRAALLHLRARRA